MHQFELETSSPEELAQVLDAMVHLLYPSSARLYLSTRKHPGFNNGSKPVAQAPLCMEFTRPRFRHIGSISDYGTERSFDRYDTLLEATMDEVRRADMNMFLRECGDGYTQWLTPEHAIITPGLRLAFRKNRHSNLDISFCHILQLIEQSEQV